MPAKSQNARWLLAVATAVLFPALVLHATCIAVMGPGTWGSGHVERLPDFTAVTPSMEEYRAEFRARDAEGPAGVAPAGRPDGPGIEGRITWTHRVGGRAVYLTEEGTARARLQRLYVSEDDRLTEARVPAGHIVARPQLAGGQLVYERWNPWALPPLGKLRRYVASWADPTLRPEAAIYGSPPEFQDWRYLLPGHSLTVAPDGKHAALLRSGALLAGYCSLHVWRTGTADATAVVSFREHAGNSGRTFALQWSRDSAVLRIFGRIGGFDRRGSREPGASDGLEIDLLYGIPDRTVYDLRAAR